MAPGRRSEPGQRSLAKDSELRQRYEINVIGVRRAGDKGTKVKAPLPDYVLRVGDICPLVAEDAEMQRCFAEVSG